MSVADKMLKEIVTLAKRLAVQEHENKSLWDSNMQIKQVRDLHAGRLREVEQELQAARAEIETLRGAMAADDQRLRDAEERVWPGRTLGCDAADAMADEILSLRRQLADAQRSASDEFAERQVLTAEQDQDAEIWKQQVDGAQAEVKYLRERLDEERSVSAGLRRKLAELESNSSVTLTSSPDAEGQQ